VRDFPFVMTNLERDAYVAKHNRHLRTIDSVLGNGPPDEVEVVLADQPFLNELREGQKTFRYIRLQAFLDQELSDGYLFFLYNPRDANPLQSEFFLPKDKSDLLFVEVTPQEKSLDIFFDPIHVRERAYVCLHAIPYRGSPQPDRMKVETRQ